MHTKPLRTPTGRAHPMTNGCVPMNDEVLLKTFDDLIVEKLTDGTA